MYVNINLLFLRDQRSYGFQNIFHTDRETGNKFQPHFGLLFHLYYCIYDHNNTRDLSHKRQASLLSYKSVCILVRCPSLGRNERYDAVELAAKNSLWIRRVPLVVLVPILFQQLKFEIHLALVFSTLEL